MTALLGIPAAVLDAVTLLVAAVRPAARPRVLHRAVALESARLGQRHAPATEARAAVFLAARTGTGLAGGLPLLAGLAVAAGYTVWPVTLLLRGRIGPGVFAVSLGVGLAAAALCWQLSVVLVAVDRRLARRLLGPDPQERLERRVAELAVSRAGVVDAVDAERRRIERDLHDGVQQRLVALGLLLGRTRRTADPAQAGALLAEAHREAAGALADLREVVWRIYPATLDQDGLAEAVRALAGRAAVPVTVRAEPDLRPAPPVARAAYFTVSEALTNVARHAAATRAEVGLTARDGRLRVRVADDGRGGADATGGGLSGLARRVAALDGTLTVRSPAGGPTEIVADLPCG